MIQPSDSGPPLGKVLSGEEEVNSVLVSTATLGRGKERQVEEPKEGLMRKDKIIM